MKIGISTASLYPMETEKALEFVCKNNIPVTEIFFNSPSETEPRFVERLAEIAKFYGTEISSVHPCGSVGEPYFLFSEYMRRCNESMKFYERYYRAAEILGAKTVVLHGDSLAGHISDEEYCRRLLLMNETAAEYGVCVSHENVNRYRAAEPENVKKFRKLTDDKLQFTFDIKQSVRAGCGAEPMYEAMRGKIINVHISDNCDSADCMLPGKGKFDFSSLFKTLKTDGYEGACLIEVYNYAYKNPKELLEAYKLVKNIHENC